MNTQTGSTRDRVRAAQILVDIVHRGRTTDQSFGTAMERGGASALLQELVFGTLRYYFCLAPLVEQHLEKPLRTKDLDLRCLLLVGAYQLHYLRIPDHAAIHETVGACRGLKKPWAKGLVNAVLRNMAEQNPDERSFGLPDWILETLRQDYPAPGIADAIARATLERAPMSLRVNVRRVEPADYTARLRAAGIIAHTGWHPEHLILDTPMPVRALPGYAEGDVSVQDSGAQLASRLVIERSPAGRILDACAAPGGKLFHMAELAPMATLVGVEQVEGRFEHLQTEARRLGHDRVQLRRGDAAGDDWRDPSVPECFDAILLDAPCSGTGTLRRHPDIKLLRQPDDLPAYVDTQKHLLRSLWPRLAPGGCLVYCTCSLFAAENDAVVADFLATTPEASAEALTLPVGQSTAHGWQLLPLPREGDGPNRTVDGFYFARLTRQEKAR